MAPVGLLESAFPAAANVASPAGRGEEVEHVRAAQQPDHLAALDHGHAPLALLLLAAFVACAGAVNLTAPSALIDTPSPR